MSASFTTSSPPPRRSAVLAERLPIEQQVDAIRTFGEMSSAAAQASFYSTAHTVKCRLIEAPFVAKRYRNPSRARALP